MGVVIYSTRVYQQEMIQRLHHSLAANLAIQPIPVEPEELDPSMLAQWFHIFTVANPSIELYLLDREGRIVGHASEPDEIERTQVSLEPIQSFLAGTETLPILGDDPRGAERRKVFSVAAILVGGELKGYLYAILGGEYYASVMQLLQRSQVLRLSVALVAICSLLGLGAGMLAFRLLTSRLRRLSTAMAEFEETGHAPRLGQRARNGRFAGDELDRLETAFDGLADRISEQVTLLEKSDGVRRELIAGVSHDLRTPLTTLRGYLETLLLMEGNLGEAERREYLASALKHGQRLSELIRSLSELARLDAPEMQAQLEPFPLGEIVQDVVQKFELAASHQGIELRAEYAPELPPVYADIGLIERVFENLIENALRYTPEGGTITVALAPQAHTIRVSVTDSGPGIPPELLPRIFDRFWRSREGTQRRSEGMGLGLAIAKRILELHGSSIEVESKLGVGSSFSFKLPTRHGISGARDESLRVL
jgi:signal transduction histidine kinase